MNYVHNNAIHHPGGWCQTMRIFADGILRDQVMLVTGGGTGIRRSIALSMADYGTHLVLASRSLEALQAVATEVEPRGGRALPCTDRHPPRRAARRHDACIPWVHSSMSRTITPAQRSDAEVLCLGLAAPGRMAYPGKASGASSGRCENIGGMCSRVCSRSVRSSVA